MSSTSYPSFERAGTVNSTVYNDVDAGIEFVSELVATSDDVDSKSKETIEVSNPIGRSADRAMRRFGDNDASNELHNNGKDSSTERGGRANPVKPSSVDGVYSKSRDVPVPRRGKRYVDTDVSLFHFNYVAGRRSENTLSVGRDDRMSPLEAKRKLLGILSMFGVENEDNEYLYTFIQSLLLAHALNGASVVGPGRANFFVNQDEYQYGDVVKFLGQDSRRFYRAYADESAKVLISVLDKYDPGDSNSVRLCGQIRSISVMKKLTQFPYLIHDSADACYRTSATEMAAVLRSKQHVLNNGSSLNSIERLESSIDA